MKRKTLSNPSISFCARMLSIGLRSENSKIFGMDVKVSNKMFSFKFASAFLFAATLSHLARIASITPYRNSRNLQFARTSPKTKTVSLKRWRQV